MMPRNDALVNWQDHFQEYPPICHIILCPCPFLKKQWPGRDSGLPTVFWGCFHFPFPVVITVSTSHPTGWIPSVSHQACRLWAAPQRCRRQRGARRFRRPDLFRMVPIDHLFHWQKVPTRLPFSQMGALWRHAWREDLMGKPAELSLKTMGFPQLSQPCIVVVAENINNENSRVIAMTLMITTMTTIMTTITKPLAIMAIIAIVTIITVLKIIIITTIMRIIITRTC